MFSLFVRTASTIALLTWVAHASALELWDGEFELGFVKTTGNTSTSSLNANINLSSDQDNWEYRTSLESLTSSSNSVSSAETYAAKGNISHHYSTENFSFINADYENNRFSGLKYRSSLSIGYGWRLFSNEAMIVDWETGPGYRLSEEADGTDRNEAIIRLAGKLEWKLSDHANFSQQLSSEIGEIEAVSRISSALTATVNSHLAVRLSYDLDHFSNIPDDKSHHFDAKSSVTLVYGF